MSLPPLASISVLSLAIVGLGLPRTALAQRTEDNVTAQSEDAFGRSVGNERIGIYNSGEVRGFSPIDAGNVRLEGLYFDRQTDPTARLVSGSSIRVGIAAQSYPFPAPTGIVDYELRRIGSAAVISGLLRHGPFGGWTAELDAQAPLAGDRLGFAYGAAAFREGFEWGGTNRGATFAVMPAWRPAANIELRPFVSGLVFSNEDAQPLMLTTDAALPPKIRREHRYTQPWAQHEGQAFNYGLIGQAELGAWSLSLGLFESVFASDAEFAELFTGIDADGRANELVIAFPDSRFGSRSGEFRAARYFEAGDRRHTLYFTVRGRAQDRRYGGEDVIDVGSVQLGVGRPIAKPEFEFTEQSRDTVRQSTGGVAYALHWKERGEMSFGFQKTSYSKSSDTPDGSLLDSKADPLLKYATATIYATRFLDVYGSYAEGLEESPVAPDNALNRNAAAPALQTDQYDAGIRLSLPADLKLIAGVYKVEKPYFDLDANGLFTQLGSVAHRGVEISLAGSPVAGLTLVAGTRILDARVSGPTVEAELIGKKPVRTARNYSIASVDYAVAGTRLSLDATAEAISRQVADSANTVEVPGRAVLHLGGRYRFELLGRPATLRGQVYNVFDKYGWSVVSGGAYVYNAPRRWTLYLAVDF